MRLSIYLTLLLKHQFRSDLGPKYILSLLGNEIVAILRFKLTDEENMYFGRYIVSIVADSESYA